MVILNKYTVRQIKAVVGASANANGIQVDIFPEMTEWS